MPIETKKGCTVVTGNAITLYRLLALKSALKLECLGMRMSRGVNVANIVRETIGSKTKNKPKLVEELEAYINLNGKELAK